MICFAGAISGIAGATEGNDSAYAQVLDVDLATIGPMVALPGSSDEHHIVPIADAAGRKIQRAYVGSCSSGRIEEIRSVAGLLRGRRVAAGVDFFVVPTSARIREQAQREGLVDIIEGAGGTVAASSCDQCIGYQDPLGAGEVAISSGVLNTPGRMGAPTSEIILSSALTVAAAAVNGRVCDPRLLLAERAESAS